MILAHWPGEDISTASFVNIVDMTIDLRHAMTEGQFDDLMEMYRSTYWARDRTQEDVRRMLERTDMIFALVDSGDERLVGFARVLTDTVYKALIFDVMVRPDRRGEGLARTLLESVLAHPELRGVKHFELYCRDDVIDLYKKWGFTQDLAGQVFMRKEGEHGGATRE